MCEHDVRCHNCTNWRVNVEREPCNGCLWSMYSNFECAICKKEKATGEMAKSK